MPESLDSEFAFLTCLERHFPSTHPSLLRGRGDDCALVAWPDKALVSADLFIEHVHFRRSYFSPSEIGHKALAVNLSDIAGMGGTALGFSMSLMVPRDANDLDFDFWDALFAGMASLANLWDVPLVGGDCSRGPCVGLSITIWGQSLRPLPRGNCSPDDVLFICGPEDLSTSPLGLARAGLMALEKNGRQACADMPAATAAHLAPRPLLDVAPALAAHHGVKSLMDVSDGLATDLPRLLGAEIAPHEGRRATSGAALQLEATSLHPELLDFCRHTARDPVREALLGGEDYCLLGACSPTAVPELQDSLPGFRVIGLVTEKPSLRCNGTDLKALADTGFDHFRG